MKNPKKTYTDHNETSCCPVPNVKDWDKAEVTWNNKKFIKEETFNLFHIPHTMGKMMQNAFNKIEKADARPPDNEWIMLSYDPSPWKGLHFFICKPQSSRCEQCKTLWEFSY